MAHANVIVLITLKDQGETNPSNLWHQQYALPSGKVAKSAKKGVQEMLAPYGYFTQAKRPAGVVHCIGWDDYWIGGGWGGQFDPQYDPMKDPGNQQQCTVCHGKGRHFAFEELGVSKSMIEKVCDLCCGTGRCAITDHRWIPVDGDIALASRLPEELDAYAIITPDGVWHECGERWGVVLHEPGFDDWEAESKRLLEQHPDAVAVNVDINT